MLNTAPNLGLPPPDHWFLGSFQMTSERGSALFAYSSLSPWWGSSWLFLPISSAQSLSPVPRCTPSYSSNLILNPCFINSQNGGYYIYSLCEAIMSNNFLSISISQLRWIESFCYFRRAMPYCNTLYSSLKFFLLFKSESVILRRKKKVIN
jgi:hypothetical protein